MIVCLSSFTSNSFELVCFPSLFPFEVRFLVVCRLLLIIVHLLVDCVGYFVGLMIILFTDYC